MSLIVIMRVWIGMASPVTWRVARAVELLVVPVRDDGDLLQLAGPGDLLQEPIGMRHVALDLEPLGLVEAPLRDGQVAHLLVGEIRARLPRRVFVGAPRERR